MRKLSTLLLSIVLIAGLALGLAACRKGGSDQGGSTGAITNEKTAKTYAATRKDPRNAAYASYKADGTKIAEFKSLANAINSAVRGGGVNAYVTQLNNSTKMFVNYEGYDKEGANDECFWYYENGVSLNSFFCYDNVTTIGDLQGSNFTTAHTQSYGKIPTQTWNSFDLVDRTGEISDTLSTHTWELSTSLDTSIMAFPKRLAGLTKSTYEIDLSNVKITPGYTTGEEVSKVYAFMGFYVWHDDYVINTGIACDVTTGNWYPYIGTSRDDSASDTVYEDKGCIMTSTWNEEGGYFVPDSESITLSFVTKVLTDDAGQYQENEFTATTNDGTVYTRSINESTVNSFFSKVAIGYNNCYVFVAGLDVKNEVTAGVKVAHADYFNGAKFENLTVTKAEGYVPTTEEMSPGDYAGIETERRGKTFNLLLATGGSEMVDYTLLNNRMFASYAKQDGKDVYSFNFDQYDKYAPITASSLSTQTKAYQNKIDLLKVVTVDNALQYKDVIAEVGTWYVPDKGVKDHERVLAAKYFNVLDFTAYLDAKKALEEAVVLDAPAKKFVDAFNKFASLKKYVMNGWIAAGDDIGKPGYLHDDYVAMKKLLPDYDALTKEMQEAVFFHMSETDFKDWSLFCTEMTALEANSVYTNPENTLTTYTPATGDKEAEATFATDKAMAQAFYWAYAIANGGKWEGEGTKIMDGDNSWFQSVFIVNCTEYVKGLGLKLPTALTTLLDSVEYDNFLAAYDAIFQTVQLAQKIKTENITALSGLSADDLAALNTYWVNGYAINGLLQWNWNYEGNKFELYMGERVARVVKLAGGTLKNGETSLKCFEYFDVVAKFLAANGYTVKENGWGVTADTIA